MHDKMEKSVLTPKLWEMHRTTIYGISELYFVKVAYCLTDIGVEYMVEHAQRMAMSLGETCMYIYEIAQPKDRQLPI